MRVVFFLVMATVAGAGILYLSLLLLIALTLGLGAAIRDGETWILVAIAIGAFLVWALMRFITTAHEIAFDRPKQALAEDGAGSPQEAAPPVVPSAVHPPRRNRFARRHM